VFTYIFQCNLSSCSHDEIGGQIHSVKRNAELGDILDCADVPLRSSLTHCVVPFTHPRVGSVVDLVDCRVESLETGVSR